MSDYASALASHYGGSPAPTTTVPTKAGPVSSSASSYASSLSAHYQSPVTTPVVSNPTPTPVAPPAIGPVKGAIQTIGNDIGAAGQGIGNFFKAFLPSSSPAMVFPVGQGLSNTGTGNGTAENAKATMIRESELGSQPVPQTPYNMSGADVAGAARAIPRTVASLAMGTSGNATEPSLMDPVSRFLLGDETIKSLPTQSAELEQNLNKAGVKGKAGTALAVTGVAANAVLNLLPFLAPFEDFAQGAADNLATNSTKVVLSPEQLQEFASRSLADANGEQLVGLQRAIAERFQQMAKTVGESGKSLTIERAAEPESVAGKIAKAFGGKNQAPAAKFSVGGAPIAGAEDQAISRVTPFSEAPIETAPSREVAPFAHETSIPEPRETQVTPFTHEQAPIGQSIDKLDSQINQIEENNSYESLKDNQQYNSLVEQRAIAMQSASTHLIQNIETKIPGATPALKALGIDNKNSTDGVFSFQNIQNISTNLDDKIQKVYNVLAGDSKPMLTKVNFGPDSSAPLKGMVAETENGKAPDNNLLNKTKQIIQELTGFRDTPIDSVPSSSVQLNAELVPGLSKTIQEDIIPKAKATSQRIADIYHEIADTVNPTGAAPKQALDIIMKNRGDFERQVFRTEQAQKSISKAWDKVPAEQQLDFMNKVETGQPVGEENKALADSYRERLNNAHLAISKYKDIPFLENFFPHFWEKPEAIEKKFIPEMATRRPFEGGKSFLKHRIFNTIQEGIAAGYKPLITNPEQLMQIYETSVRKFLMAQKIKEDLKPVGMWKIIPNNKSLPAGFTYIDDPIARAYFPQGQVESPRGLIESYAQYGRAAAPTPVARLINNHLSTDWVQKSAIGKSLMQAKNSLNALQLGFSAFHVTFETLMSTMNGLDVAISKFTRGEFLGATKALMKAPFNVVNYWRDGQKFYNGDLELLKIEEDIFHGGATLRHNQYFKNTVMDNFGKNVREGNMVGALGRAPFAALEGGMRIIMSQVPKLKIGAFRELFGEEVARKSSQIASGKITKATIARETWANIENRFGQLNYDNLFWNRTFKAVNMLTWRAVGWNLGTIRELGGATTQDAFRFANDALHGRKPDFTPKMRITISIVAVIAGLSAIYEKLHTGHGPRKLIDYIAPENGDTDSNGDSVRVNWPAYTKDLLSYANSPLQTVANKMSPEMTMAIELLQNKDYYGNYIYNPNDKLPTKLQQTLGFLANELKPFSISNQQQLTKDNATLEQKTEGYMGIQKAPSNVSQSDKTKAIFNSMSPSGPKTPEQQAASQLKNDYRKQIQQGNIPSLDELIKKGIVTDAKGYRAFIKAAGQSPAQRAYKTLPKSVKSTIQKP